MPLALLGWGVAALAYRSALALAVDYGETVRVAFDLYRRLLFKEQGMPTPKALEAERLLWDDLVQFFLRNLPPSSMLS